MLSRTFILRRINHELLFRSFSSQGELPVPKLHKFDRNENLQKLSKEQYDVLVIGGGTVGCSCALDASLRGYKVALVEKNDFASFTSGKSTNLYHGGIRYLEQALTKFDYGALKLVQEALRERRHLLNAASYLSSPCPTIIPTTSFINTLYAYFGTKIYDFLSRKKSSLPSSRWVSKTFLFENFPSLNTEKISRGILYYDGIFNDTRMNTVIAKTAAYHGVNIVNHADVVELVKSNDILVGAKIKDQFSDSIFNINSKYIINATGPYSDDIRHLDDENVSPTIVHSSGVHIVVDKSFCPREYGLVQSTKDGRVLFILPWLNSTLIGTTDNKCDLTDYPKPDISEISYIIEEVSKFLSIPLQLVHIKSSWSGIRPLVNLNIRANNKPTKPSTDINNSNTNNSTEKTKNNSSKKAKGDTAVILREHYISISPSKLISIQGGKWTTTRKMAEDTIDELCKLDKKKIPCKTKMMLYDGSDYNNEFCSNDFTKLIDNINIKYNNNKDSQNEALIPLPTIKHLVSNYGIYAINICELIKEDKSLLNRIMPTLPHIYAEIYYCLENEMAISVSDIIARRLRLLSQDNLSTLSLLPNIVRLMKNKMGWDKERTTHEIEDALEVIYSTFFSKTQFNAIIKTISDKLDELSSE